MKGWKKGALSHRSLFVVYARCPYLYKILYEDKIKIPVDFWSDLYRIVGYCYHTLMERKIRQRLSWDELVVASETMSVVDQIILGQEKGLGFSFPWWARERMRADVQQKILNTAQSSHKFILDRLEVAEKPFLKEMSTGVFFYGRVDALGRGKTNKGLLLVDYKGSRYSSKSFDNGRQLVYYSLLIPAKIEEAYYYYAGDDSIIPVDINNKGLRAWVYEWAMKCADGIASGHRKPRHSSCASCFARSVCPERV